VSVVREVQVRNPSTVVRRLIELTGLADALHVTPSGPVSLPPVPVVRAAATQPLPELSVDGRRPRKRQAPLGAKPGRSSRSVGP